VVIITVDGFGGFNLVWRGCHPALFDFRYQSSLELLWFFV